MKRSALWLCAILALFLFACSPQKVPPTPTSSLPPTEPSPTPQPTEPTSLPEEPEVLPTETSEPALPPLPRERQPITITTSDGRTLEGYYYPSAVNPAPTIIMMHWAPGTLEDFQELAPWLQNRANNEERLPVLDCEGGPFDFLIGPWLDPTWFPPLDLNASFGIVVFNFGGCGNSQQGDYLEDSKAAFITASQLEGVDPHKLSSIGASIGADGAPDGCTLFNQAVVNGEANGKCLGAVSLSPGSYFGMPYADAVQSLQMEGPPIPVHCLAAANDGPSPNTCNNAKGPEYQVTIYDGADHGMWLIKPERDPNVLDLFIDFLEKIYGIQVGAE